MREHRVVDHRVLPLSYHDSSPSDQNCADKKNELEGNRWQSCSESDSEHWNVTRDVDLGVAAALCQGSGPQKP